MEDINDSDRYEYTAKGALNNWKFVDGRSTYKCSDTGSEELLKEVKSQLGLPSEYDLFEKIRKGVAEFIEGKSCTDKFTFDHIKSYSKAAKEEDGRIVKRTADILASFVKGEFISFERWNYERKNSLQPKAISSTPWYCYLVSPHGYKNGAEEEKTFCILRYWIKIQTDLSATLKTSNREYHSKKGSEIQSGYYHFRLIEKNISTPIIRDLFLNYPMRSMRFVEGYMITYTTQSQLSYSRILLESAPNTKMPRDKDEIKVILFHSKEYFSKVNRHLRKYFGKISKHFQETATYGITDTEKVIKAANEHNRPRKAFKYDLYISSMATSAKRKEIEACQKIGHYLIQILTEGFTDSKGIQHEPIFKKEKIYAPALMESDLSPLSAEDAMNEELSVGRYKEGRQDFHISKHHLLLMPFNVRSAAYDQATWCFYRSRKHMKCCVAIVQDQKHLSKLFSKDNFGDNGWVVPLGNNPYEIETVKTILQDHFEIIRKTYTPEDH